VSAIFVPVETGMLTQLLDGVVIIALHRMSWKSYVVT